METRSVPAIQDDPEEFLLAVVQTASDHGACDIIFVPGQPPRLSTASDMVAMDVPPLTAADLGYLIRFMLENRSVARRRPLDVVEQKDAEFVALLGQARYRVSVYQQRGDLAMVMRPVWQAIPSLRDLGLPAQLEELLRRKRGLILVAGPSAAGKSTSLAAMVQFINLHRTCHIISIENPVEVVHQPLKSIISQRSIPEDAVSYSRAVRAALREAPDVLVVGDVHDVETATAALAAAESGHLVIAAIHSKDSIDAINRIEGFFEPAARKQVSVQVSGSLLAILVQQLLTRRDAVGGRVLALEFLLATAAIRHLIRTNQVQRLYVHMQGGRELGMRTMDESLAAFARSGIIDYGDALMATADVGNFMNLYRRSSHRQAGSTGRAIMSRRQRAQSGHMQYALPTSYRAEMLAVKPDTWNSSGLLRFRDGVLHYTPDPFQHTLYAQISDYSIWTGLRQPFVLAHYGRVIVSAQPSSDLPPPTARRPPSQGRIWVLIMGTDGSLISCPAEHEEGQELPPDGRWHTLFFPIDPEYEGLEVRAYAVRISPPGLEIRVREVLFN